MIYKSKTHPQFDMSIDYVNYEKDDETGNIIKDFSIICWCNINKTEFDKFCDEHCKSKESTFPYPYGGECQIDSMKQRLKKYNLEFVGLSDDEVTIYRDDGFEYASGFNKMHSKLSQNKKTFYANLERKKNND